MLCEQLVLLMTLCIVFAGSVERTRKYQKGKAPEKVPARPTIEAGFCRQVWERLTGASADSAPTKGQALQGLKVPWLRKRCGLCANCKKANAGFVDKQRGVDMCLALPKVLHAIFSDCVALPCQLVEQPCC